LREAVDRDELFAFFNTTSLFPSKDLEARLKLLLSLDFVAVVVLLEARLALRKLLLIFLITDETDSASASSGSLSTNIQKTIMVF
jgi:hypothetical protein